MEAKKSHQIKTEFAATWPHSRQPHRSDRSNEARLILSLLWPGRVRDTNPVLKKITNSNYVQVIRGRQRALGLGYQSLPRAWEQCSRIETQNAAVFSRYQIKIDARQRKYGAVSLSMCLVVRQDNVDVTTTC